MYSTWSSEPHGDIPTALFITKLQSADPSPAYVRRYTHPRLSTMTPLALSLLITLIHLPTTLSAPLACEAQGTAAMN